MSISAFLRRFLPQPYFRKVRGSVLAIRLPDEAPPQDGFCVREELKRLAPDHWLAPGPHAFEAVCLHANDGVARIARIRAVIAAHCEARPSMRGTRFGEAEGDFTVMFDRRGRPRPPIMGPANGEAMRLAGAMAAQAPGVHPSAGVAMLAPDAKPASQMTMSSTVAEILEDKARNSTRKGVYSVPPESTVARAVALMAENAISSAVVMEGGKMVGLITLKELLKGLHSRGGALLELRCADIMKADPPVTDPVATVDHLRSLMTELHITHVPVMSQGTLLGVVSFHDIARSAIKDADFENKLLKQYIKNWPE
jgi:CBS domain-containing protein